MQAVVASVSLAVPAFARLLEQTLSFADARFVAAVVVSLAVIAIGVVGRQTGTVRLTRIMREGAVEGETQEPPCGTNVVLTTF